MQKHKSFRQFTEQTRNTHMPRVVSAKVQPKPKVSDPSTGVDIDDKGRWEGQIVGKGKEIKPKEVVKVKDGVKGPDPNLPAGSANPNKNKKDYEVAGTNWDLYNWMNKTYGLPAAEWKRKNPTKPDAANPHLPAGSYVPKA
jgi:hypothetical protein